jgi:hypothetical protein
MGGVILITIYLIYGFVHGEKTATVFLSINTYAEIFKLFFNVSSCRSRRC